MSSSGGRGTLFLDRLRRFGRSGRENAFSVVWSAFHFGGCTVNHPSTQSVHIISTSMSTVSGCNDEEGDSIPMAYVQWVDQPVASVLLLIRDVSHRVSYRRD